MQTIRITREQARRFLVTYHFQPGTIPEIVERLGTIQYDPLNPVGRNPDLVLQARVPGYHIDDWQQTAYQDRLLYDSWDKQACLVLASDWAQRALIRSKYNPYHDRTVLTEEAEIAQAMLRRIDNEGPLGSLEFEDKKRYSDEHSWYGATRSKRVLRALWATGALVTHHRSSGRHYYDRPERIIPPHYFQEPDQLDEETYIRWMIRRRIQATGLLRTSAEAAIWSACGPGPGRRLAFEHLHNSQEIVRVVIEEPDVPKNVEYFMLRSNLPILEQPETAPQVRLLAPLDSFLWDRRAIRHLFNFDYTWEVYKPVEQRRWGYYVLPVLYGERFIGRVDSRLEKGTWKILNWWTEEGIEWDGERGAALEEAFQQFAIYLNAQEIRNENRSLPIPLQALVELKKI